MGEINAQTILGSGISSFWQGYSIAYQDPIGSFFAVCQHFKNMGKLAGVSDISLPPLGSGDPGSGIWNNQHSCPICALWANSGQP